MTGHSISPFGDLQLNLEQVNSSTSPSSTPSAVPLAQPQYTQYSYSSFPPNLSSRSVVSLSAGQSNFYQSPQASINQQVLSFDQTGTPLSAPLQIPNDNYFDVLQTNSPSGYRTDLSYAQMLAYDGLENELSSPNSVHNNDGSNYGYPSHSNQSNNVASSPSTLDFTTDYMPHNDLQNNAFLSVGLGQLSTEAFPNIDLSSRRPNSALAELSSEKLEEIAEKCNFNFRRFYDEAQMEGYKGTSTEYLKAVWLNCERKKAESKGLSIGESQNARQFNIEVELTKEKKHKLDVLREGREDGEVERLFILSGQIIDSSASSSIPNSRKRKLPTSIGSKEPSAKRTAKEVNLLSEQSSVQGGLSIGSSSNVSKPVIKKAQFNDESRGDILLSNRAYKEAKEGGYRYSKEIYGSEIALACDEVGGGLSHAAQNFDIEFPLHENNQDGSPIKQQSLKVSARVNKEGTAFIKIIEIKTKTKARREMRSV